MSIIKKTIAFLLIAALCLGGTVLAEEAQSITAEDYLGEWVDLDGTCNIDIMEHTDGETIDGYVVNVEMPVVEKDGLSYVVWAYGCVWNDETQTLKSITRFTGKGDYEPIWITPPRRSALTKKGGLSGATKTKPPTTGCSLCGLSAGARACTRASGASGWNARPSSLK